MFGYLLRRVFRLAAVSRTKVRKPPPINNKPRIKYHRTPTSDQIIGRVYVIDGDSIKCQGYEIRLDDIDAPEYHQTAYNYEGKEIRIGAIAKSALIKRLAGKTVEVKVSKTDRYGRTVGTVFCEGENINLWLIKRGMAVSAFGNRYFKAEQWAKEKKLGIWGLNSKYTPQEWRNRFNRKP